MDWGEYYIYMMSRADPMFLTLATHAILDDIWVNSVDQDQPVSMHKPI